MEHSEEGGNVAVVLSGACSKKEFVFLFWSGHRFTRLIHQRREFISLQDEETRVMDQARGQAARRQDFG